MLFKRLMFRLEVRRIKQNWQNGSLCQSDFAKIKDILSDQKPLTPKVFGIKIDVLDVTSYVGVYTRCSPIDLEDVINFYGGYFVTNNIVLVDLKYLEEILAETHGSIIPG